MLTRELDHDALRRDAAATDVARAARAAEVLISGEPGGVPLPGGTSFTDVNRVAS